VDIYILDTNQYFCGYMHVWNLDTSLVSPTPSLAMLTIHKFKMGAPAMNMLLNFPINVIIMINDFLGQINNPSDSIIYRPTQCNHFRPIYNEKFYIVFHAHIFKNLAESQQKIVCRKFEISVVYLQFKTAEKL